MYCRAAVLLALFPVGLSAQSTVQSRSGVTTVVPESESPLAVTVASAIFPGAGQILLRQKRSAVYMAIEAAGLAYYISQNRDGNRDRRRYRALARDVARVSLSPDGPDGDWDYYERMEKFVASGSWDRIAGGPVDPETDDHTYNGAIWLLARETFWRDPNASPGEQSEEYKSAISFYLERAVTPEYLWSWSASPEAYQKYRSAIASSNSAFRKAEQTAGVIIANHFLSAIDAYSSVRMRVRRNADGITTLSASFSF